MDFTGNVWFLNRKKKNLRKSVEFRFPRGHFSFHSVATKIAFLWELWVMSPLEGAAEKPDCPQSESGIRWQGDNSINNAWHFLQS